MSTFRHTNNAGTCPKCLQICNLFPGLNTELKRWFFEQQKIIPSFHVSEAGRGRNRQELLFSSGASNAHYEQSAHNYNCAIDTFFLVDGKLSYHKLLYAKLKIPATLNWYGSPGSKFYERPHIEIRNWKDLKDQKLVTLVEK